MAIDPRERPSSGRNENGACNFFIGSPSDEIRAGRANKEGAASLRCERRDCGKTWAEHFSTTTRSSYQPSAPAAAPQRRAPDLPPPGTRRY